MRRSTRRCSRSSNREAAALRKGAPVILAIYTLIHVAISLVGIFSCFVVMYGLLNSQRLAGWTSVFLWTTIATSVTGFFFPVHRFMASHAMGIISLILFTAVTIGCAIRFHPQPLEVS